MKKSFWVIFLLVGVLFSLCAAWNADDIGLTSAQFDLSVFVSGKQFIKIIPADATISNAADETDFRALPNFSSRLVFINGNSNGIDDQIALGVKLAVFNNFESEGVNIEMYCEPFKGNNSSYDINYLMMLGEGNPITINSTDLVATRFVVPKIEGQTIYMLNIVISVNNAQYMAAPEDAYYSSVHVALVTR